MSATSPKNPYWGWSCLLAALLLVVAWPVVHSWLQVLWIREPSSDNALQALVLIVIGVTLWRPATQRPLPHWRPDARGLIGVAAMMSVMGVAGFLSIKTLYWFGFLGMLSMTFWTVFGLQAWLRWLPFFLFSLFLIPKLPTDLEIRISLPLQMLSTQLTAALSGLFIPIETTGNIFWIRGEAFEVTAACSGLHTWTGFLFAGMLWMLFERFSFRLLGISLVLAPLLAIGLNAVRLFITALVAYYYSADAGEAIHTNLEYVLFPVGLVLMWLLLGRLARTMEDKA